MGSLVFERNRSIWARRAVSALALGLAVAVGSPPASAATEEETAAARSLAQQGLEAFNSGEFQQAADLFERAEALVHSPVHLLYKARAHAKLGQLVKAQESYIKIIREKLAADAPRSFSKAQESARSELEEIKPRLAKLTVQINGPEQGAQLTLDGQPVPAVLIGVPMPVDPGEHQLEATAEGFSSDTATITVAEGQREAIELTLQEAPGAATGAPGGAQGAGASAQSAADLGTASDDSNTLRVLSYVGFGVGAVGLGVGTVFLLQGSSKSDDADALYSELEANAERDADSDPNFTDREKREIQDADDEANSATNIGVAGLVVGGLGVATGVTLFILSSDSEESANAPRITPWVGYRSAGISGTF